MNDNVERILYVRTEHPGHGATVLLLTASGPRCGTA